MAALLALASATTFGFADFLGGLASRRAHPLVVAALSQAAGLAVLAVVLPLAGVMPTATAMWFGGVAGIAGAGGLIFYFRALAIGPMGVTAPLAAVVGAALPVGVGVAMGERPGPLAFVGIALGIAAVALASRPGPTADGTPVDVGAGAPDGLRAGAPDGLRAGAPDGLRAGLTAAVLAGVAFGVFFVTLDAAPDDGGLWPLLGARITGIVLLAGLLGRHRPALPDPRGIGIGLVSGLLDMTANVLFLLATQTGMLALVAVLTSLYPVGIVLLARAVLRERLGRVQWLGVAAAVGATILIAL
jgi:drug/metabolite transporter (DMT)-like permease